MNTTATVIDAATVLSCPVSVTQSGLEVRGEHVPARRGWLRRLAPDGWAGTVDATGIDAAIRSAAVSTIAAIARDERVSWLTPLDALGAAENKPFQYRRAGDAGVPVPRWIVTTDIDAVPTDGNWISKPLGPGSFIDGDGQGWIVPTTIVDLSEPETIAGAPFVIQEQVRARTHARIVTVGESAYSATLPADGLPLDWRLAAEAHHSFTAEAAPAFVLNLALTAARSVGVGYSAQDWICGERDRWWLVDLNPAGQWLFLPEIVAARVTTAIAQFLDEAEPA